MEIKLTLRGRIGTETQVWGVGKSQYTGRWEEQQEGFAIHRSENWKCFSEPEGLGLILFHNLGLNSHPPALFLYN